MATFKFEALAQEVTQLKSAVQSVANLPEVSPLRDQSVSTVAALSPLRLLRAAPIVRPLFARTTMLLLLLLLLLLHYPSSLPDDCRSR